MPLLLAKVTVLFLSALVTLALLKRVTPEMRHLLGVCALAGSLILPVGALLPSQTFSIPLPAIIVATVVSRSAAQSAVWPPFRVFYALWALGLLAMLIRLAFGYRRIAGLVRGAALLQDEIHLANVNVPLVSGLFQPVILMPRRAAEWPAWQFDAAIRHERMHVRRLDLQSNFIAQVACAVWWFHPLAWALSRRLRDDREAACDDAVLASGFEPAAYAEALLAVSQQTNPTLISGCSMTTQMNLKTRITRLLDSRIARTTSRTNLFRTAAAFTVLLAALGLLSPQSNAQSESVYKVGGEVTTPRLVYRVDPDYTEEARQDKIAGTVILSVVVGADGLAQDIRIVKSLDTGLDRKAVEALTKWRFAPGTLRGEPVAVRATIEINFKLD